MVDLQESWGAVSVLSIVHGTAVVEIFHFETKVVDQQTNIAIYRAMAKTLTFLLLFFRKAQT